MKYTIQDFLSSKIALDVNEKDRPEFNRLMDEAGMKWACGCRASVHGWFPCRADGKALRWSRGTLPVVSFSDLAPYTPADFFSGRIGVRCDTRAEYDALMRECEAKGLRWATGVAPSHESIIGFFGDKYPVQIATNAINERDLYWRGKTQDLRGNIPCVPFRAIFPDPWAEFAAGKCYLRVKKEEWAEFAKRCIEAGMCWERCGLIQPVGYRGGLGGDGDYFTQGDGKFLDGYDINTRDDMPVIDFSTLLPAPAPSPRIEITVAGRVTTATLYEDGKAVRTGTATCGLEDKFDLMEGAHLAMHRLHYGQDRTPLRRGEASEWVKRLDEVLTDMKRRMQTR